MEDYSLALKRVAKFPKAFPEHHGNEERAGTVAKSYVFEFAPHRVLKRRMQCFGIFPILGLQPEGGTFRNGEYGWLSAGSYMEIVEMSSGFKVSRFDFASQFG